MSNRRKPRHFEDDEAVQKWRSWTDVWLLRLLAYWGGSDARAVLIQHSSEALVDLGLCVEPGEDGLNTAKLDAVRLLSEMEGGISFPQESPATTNLRWLQSEFSLSDLDARILLLTSLERKCGVLSAVFENAIGYLSTEALVRLLAIVLDEPIQAIRESLHDCGQLTETGLARVDHRGNFLFSDKLEVLSGLPDKILASQNSLLGLFESSFVPSVIPSGFTMEDFGYVDPKVGDVVALLRHASATGLEGVNVLLHGLPGCGKTTLASLLCQWAGLSPFAIAVKSSQRRERISGTQRLTAYSAAQQLLKKRRGSAIVFDETETIFAGSAEESQFNERPGISDKAFINVALETNGTPAIWVTNSLRAFDASYLRRFSVVIEIPIPPQSVRESLVRRHLEGMASARLCHTLAKHSSVSPGLVSKSSDTVRAMIAGGSMKSATDLLPAVLNGSLTAMGHRPLEPLKASADLPFRMDCINCDENLEKIVRGVRAHGDPELRALIYGMPGTGKSEWVRHLARELDRELLVYRASDILGSFVGESEQNVARMFAKAGSTKAVLLVDEADSFLCSRLSVGAQRWQAGLVNEFLQQLEAFSGICFMTTNLVDGLDHAVLRRFDLKLEFKALLPDQTRAMLKQYAEVLCLEDKGAVCVEALRGLCLGDFAVIFRQHRFNPITSVGELVARLQVEIGSRMPQRRGVGFLAAA